MTGPLYGGPFLRANGAQYFNGTARRKIFPSLIDKNLPPIVGSTFGVTYKPVSMVLFALSLT